MPMAPGDPAQAQLAQATGGTGPGAANFLMAAADMANSGQLPASPAAPRSAPMPQGRNLQTGFVRRRMGRRGLRVVR